jgi:hypothetical protein
MVTHIPLAPEIGFGKAKWEFIVKAENGNIYGIPGRAKQVLKIVPKLREIKCIGPVFDGSGCKWGRGSELDGTIYCPPASAQTILCIDTKTDEVCEKPCHIETKTKDIGALMHRPVKWYGAIKANGMLWCPPMGMNQVLCIEIGCNDTPRCKLVGPKQLYGRRGSSERLSYGWSYGALASNGRIYCTPCDATKVLMIDPSTKDVKMVGPDLGPRKFKWIDAVLAWDGNLYCSPTTDDKALRIKPLKDGTCAAERFGQDFDAYKNQGWGTGTLGHDGRIYYPPRRESMVLRIDPVAGKTELIGPQLKRLRGSKWCGAAEVGRFVYAVPSDSQSVLGFTLDTVNCVAEGKVMCLPRDPAKRFNHPEIRKRMVVAKHFQQFRQQYLHSWLLDHAHVYARASEAMRRAWQKIAGITAGSSKTNLSEPLKLREVAKKGALDSEEMSLKAGSGKASGKVSGKASPFKPTDPDARSDDSVSTASDEDSDTRSEASLDDLESIASGECGDKVDSALDSAIKDAHQHAEMGISSPVYRNFAYRRSHPRSPYDTEQEFDRKDRVRAAQVQATAVAEAKERELTAAQIGALRHKHAEEIRLKEEELSSQLMQSRELMAMIKEEAESKILRFQQEAACAKDSRDTNEVTSTTSSGTTSTGTSGTSTPATSVHSEKVVEEMELQIEQVRKVTATQQKKARKQVYALRKAHDVEMQDLVRRLTPSSSGSSTNTGSSATTPGKIRTPGLVTPSRALLAAPTQALSASAVLSATKKQQPDMVTPPVAANRQNEGRHTADSLAGISLLRKKLSMLRATAARNRGGEPQDQPKVPTPPWRSRQLTSAALSTEAFMEKSLEEASRLCDVGPLPVNPRAGCAACGMCQSMGDTCAVQ